MNLLPDMRNRGRKKGRDTLGGSGANDREGRWGVPLPEPWVSGGGGLSRGAGCKTDTSKSLHMGNVSGRGTAVSCEFIGTDNNSGTEPVKVSKVLRLTFFFFADSQPRNSVC